MFQTSGIVHKVLFCEGQRPPPKASYHTTSQALYFWEKAEVGLCSYQQLYQWCSTSAGIVTLQKSSQPNFARLRCSLEDEGFFEVM